MEEPRDIKVQEFGAGEQNALNFSQKAMKVTGVAIAESISSESLLETEQPEFLFDVKNGMAPVNKVRGRKGLAIKAEDMIDE